ncbi:Ser/Thr protein phosphatase, putative [Trichomonas vaginalis G3]|uniref:Serine/threonine-protein phosphatase n=1 Tax=Trichomonas vaginalis (strain ATCC PRA-98 / G3) TaxID=412133 RepID=A2E069_TRIV3|nr:serine/threonine protein phosphatase family [Trichomonas vaginalis G3]EAY13988.1 Ser/Thr protein phosphatase, putative [Trichomonas vaginalis G3]KAI5551813.1 serine/threonine protein phosphatase family [Trichomonas vaginalis G3]|eukprot:XP_001326211.1 Ser/Thr protein phosphatase [Trichomonas vaginalis G3]
MVNSDLANKFISLIEESIDTGDLKLPNNATMNDLCTLFKEQLKLENTLVENLHGNFIVVGDLHGNFQDLYHIITKYGLPSSSVKYLFLGDYVDRGEKSLEVYIYLMCLKILYPKFITLIRGNHEYTITCKEYGFLDECISRLGVMRGPAVFKMINDTFPYLPLAAILPNKIFCVHGGISSNVNTLDDIRNINRFEIDTWGKSVIATDLTWGDPRYLKNGVMTESSDRGLGERYSLAKAKRFLYDNELTSIIRAHEVCEGGWEKSLVDCKGNILCMTVFSAANYCGLENHASVLAVDNTGGISIDVFDSNGDEIRCNDTFEFGPIDLNLLIPPEEEIYLLL